MVEPGDSCILAGIFSESTIKAFSRRVGENGSVLVIEANPLNIERLKRNTSILKNVCFTNKAVWRESGEMEFLTSSQDRAQGYNRLASPELQDFPVHMVENPQTIKVPTDTLDNITKESGLKKVSHVNLTINGAELQALEAIDEIQKANPKMRIYINSEMPVPAEKTIQRLKQKGFRVYLSHWIRTLNRKIRLVRIYAVGGGR